MLLTIHNLPISTRYADVKSLLKEKCGLTDIILDNLANEGKNKKVTVGLASDDDGAIVVRKLNGMFINGQQLYIEDRRRTTADQPYRPAEFEAAAQNIEQPVMAPIPVWNQNPSTSYTQPMPVNQNLLAYSGYGVAPQVTHFMEPQPVPVELPGYSGYQAEAYAPNNTPRNQESGDWRVNIRNQVSDTSRHQNRKRHHSPDRLAADRKRSSRFDNFNEAKSSREASSPRQQRGVKNRASQEQFLRSNQNVEPTYQPRKPNSNSRHTAQMWTNLRWNKSTPPEQWGNDNRDREHQADKVWDNQPRQWENQQEPQWENQQEPQWESPPKPRWESPPKPRWESPPKPRWESPPKPRLESPLGPQWNSQPKPQWDRPQKAQRNSPPKSQWGQPKPQWDDRIPVENIRSEWYDHLASSYTSRGNDRDFQPLDRERYNDSRSRNKGCNEPIGDPNWNRDPERTFSSPVRQERPVDDGQRDRPRSRNGRQGSYNWRDRSITSRDHSGAQQNPDCGKPKEYSSREFKRQTRSERVAPKATQNRVTPRHEKEKLYNKQNVNRNRLVQEKKTYPPVSEPLITKPVEGRYETNKHQTIRSMINKDQSNRGQAIALLAKKIYGVGQNTPFHSKSPLDAFIFKQLKGCVKSRIDVLFGEELSVHIGDVIKRYRSKYPVSGDQTLMMQIREKSPGEFDAFLSKMPKKKVLQDGAANVTEVKEEKSDAAQNEADSKTEEIKKGSTTNDKEETPAPVKKLPEPPVPPSVRRLKPGQPLTDKQVIQQMKLLRKWEYDQDDLYSLDEATARALDDEMAGLDNLFTEECSKPVDQQEALICKRITRDSLNDFNKTIRLYISKRFLNIQTGLAVRMFASGKPPKKEAVLQYLKKHRIVASAVKKSVKGSMFMINVTKFDDFDVLCNIENDVIDGIPVSFKAMHLIGPPPKIRKNQIKSMRQKTIEDQIQGVDIDELEDVDFGGKGDDAEADAGAANGKNDVAEEDFTKDDFTQAKDFCKDIGVTEDFSKDFVEEVNIDNINEDDLEDF